MSLTYGNRSANGCLRSLAKLGQLALVEPEDCGECLIDTPQILVAQPSDSFAKPLHVDRTELLGQHPRRFRVHFYLRTERRSPSARGRWRHQDDRPRKKFISLQHDAVTNTELLMPEALRDLESIDVTPLHGETPSSPQPPASRFDLPRQLPVRLPLERERHGRAICALMQSTRHELLRKWIVRLPQESEAPDVLRHPAEQRSPLPWGRVYHEMQYKGRRATQSRQ
jgi:hypothetical protein